MRLKNVNPFGHLSPIVLDYRRVDSFDDVGKAYTAFIPCSCKDVTRELGSVENWSLQKLVKAGIDPNTGIHTGYATRLDGLNDLASFSNMADSLTSKTDE